MKPIIFILIGILIIAGCSKNTDSDNFLITSAYFVGYISGTVDTIKSITENIPFEQVICDRHKKLDTEFTLTLVKNFNITC